jgi:amino acid transporter
MGVLRTKSIEQSIRDTKEAEHRRKKDLSAWDLVLEFGLGASAVSVGWAEYFSSLLPIPESISGEGSVNPAAGAIVLLLTAVAIVGVKLSSRCHAVPGSSS